MNKEWVAERLNEVLTDMEDDLPRSVDSGIRYIIKHHSKLTHQLHHALNLISCGHKDTAKQQIQRVLNEVEKGQHGD